MDASGILLAGFSPMILKVYRGKNRQLPLNNYQFRTALRLGKRSVSCGAICTVMSPLVRGNPIDIHVNFVQMYGLPPRVRGSRHSSDCEKPS